MEIGHKASGYEKCMHGITSWISDRKPATPPVPIPKLKKIA